MEVIFLPAWANFAAIVAIILLCATAWGGKINNSMSNIMTLSRASFKGAYYAFAALAVVLLGSFFFIIAPITGDTNWLIGINLGILFLSFLVCVLGGMDSDNINRLIMRVAIASSCCLMFATLMFANVGYAAIWIGAVAMFGILGHLLFSPNKGEKK